MFTVNGKTKHPSLKLFVERYRKFPLKVQDGIEVLLTEGLPYNSARSAHLSRSCRASAAYLRLDCRAPEFVCFAGSASHADEDGVSAVAERQLGL
jgi:hypothetical protein